MNLEDFYFLVQIMAGIAVVVSIAYLARQVRHNTEVARSSMRHGITNSAMIGGQILAENAELADAMIRFNRGEDLRPEEDLRLQALAYATTRNWENIHYQFLTGMLTETEWIAYRKNLMVLIRSRTYRDYWEREQDIYTESFRAEVARILDEIGAGDRTAEKSALFPREGTS